MTLPRLLLLTDRHQLPAGRGLVDQVTLAVEAGLRAVILRERDLEDRERAELAFDLTQLLAAVDGRLIVAAPELGSPHGVHLRAADPWPRTRPPLVGRSCHDAAEVQRARTEAVDYLLVSPVARSESKPGYGPPLGRRTLQRLASSRDVAGRPAVYALGGVGPGTAATWIAAGADGVAVMGAVMRADDPRVVVRALLAESRVTDRAFPHGTDDTRLGAQP
ncbi:MAG: thiamine phosphate synthase [Propionibacteriales bacterium]|nr:thiamine phosphate synthase [Propionibacteriales bacterium]